MPLSDFLLPKSKEEILSALEERALDPDFIKLIQESDLAYSFVTGFLSNNEGPADGIVEQLNGLAVIIKGLS